MEEKRWQDVRKELWKKSYGKEYEEETRGEEKK
jgi:hypothetical protein